MYRYQNTDDEIEIMGGTGKRNNKAFVRGAAKGNCYATAGRGYAQGGVIRNQFVTEQDQMPK